MKGPKVLELKIKNEAIPRYIFWDCEELLRLHRRDRERERESLLELSGLQGPKSIIGGGSFVQQRRQAVVGTTILCKGNCKNM